MTRQPNSTPASKWHPIVHMLRKSWPSPPTCDEHTSPKPRRIDVAGCGLSAYGPSSALLVNATLLRLCGPSQSQVHISTCAMRARQLLGRRRRPFMSPPVHQRRQITTSMVVHRCSPPWHIHSVSAPALFLHVAARSAPQLWLQHGAPNIRIPIVSSGTWAPTPPRRGATSGACKTASTMRALPAVGCATRCLPLHTFGEARLDHFLIMPTKRSVCLPNQAVRT